MAERFFVNYGERTKITFDQVNKGGMPVDVQKSDIEILKALFCSPKIRNLFDKIAEAGYFLRCKQTDPSSKG